MAVVIVAKLTLEIRRRAFFLTGVNIIIEHIFYFVNMHIRNRNAPKTPNSGRLHLRA